MFYLFLGWSELGLRISPDFVTCSCSFYRDFISFLLQLTLKGLNEIKFSNCDFNKKKRQNSSFIPGNVQRKNAKNTKIKDTVWNGNKIPCTIAYMNSEQKCWVVPSTKTFYNWKSYLKCVKSSLLQNERRAREWKKKNWRKLCHLSWKLLNSTLKVKYTSFWWNSKKFHNSFFSIFSSIFKCKDFKSYLIFNGS